MRFRWWCGWFCFDWCGNGSCSWCWSGRFWRKRRRRSSQRWRSQRCRCRYESQFQWLYAFFQGGSQALFQSVKIRWYQVRRLVSTRLCLRYSLLGRSTVRGILSSLRSLGRQLALSNLRNLTNWRAMGTLKTRRTLRKWRSLKSLLTWYT